jgi:oxygen-independent coproporphyrinogen-3 oxidase
VRAADDSYAEEFLQAHKSMSAAGFEHYEVSNFGKPGYRSRHNSAYWTGSHYLGIGPSAHSFNGDSRWWNVRNYPEWLERVNTGASPVVETEKLTADNRDAERVYLGLRTSGGLEGTELELRAAGHWVLAGWATVDKDVIRLTAEGWLRLDSLASQLTAT